MNENALRSGFVGTLMLVLTAGCSGPPAEGADDKSTGIRVGLSLGAPSDEVASVLFEVFEGDTNCGGEPIAAAARSLEEEPFPASLLPPGGGLQHPFADAFFVLAPGTYTVCAIPRSANGQPSEKCEVARAAVVVSSSSTIETILVSQCQGTPNGALDAIALFNDPPSISSLQFFRSKFVKACERMTIAATGFDPNGDDFRFEWFNSDPSVFLAPFESFVSFSSSEPGDFEMRVAIVDRFGASSDLTFLVHVMENEGCTPNFCAGTPGEWQGCRGSGCWVCSENLEGYPNYLANHPGCIANPTCQGFFFTCNEACPAPSEADR